MERPTSELSRAKCDNSVLFSARPDLCSSLSSTHLASVRILVNTRGTTDFVQTLYPTTSHCLATISSHRTTPPRRSHFFLTREMANQSGSVSFQTLLESALLRYEEETGVSLSTHPLALQLQSCNSVEDFNKLLQDKAKDVRESERITKSMKTIVSILTPLNSVASLHAVGLVR